MIENLTHNGVLFPKKFTSKGFDVIFGERISLLAEEMLWKIMPFVFNEKYKGNLLFFNNVWVDIKSQLPPALQDKIFPNDFIDIFDSMRIVDTRIKLENAEKNKFDKEKITNEKLKIKEKYGYCIKNGMKTEISNPYVETSRFFISRGNLCGRWVSYVDAEDVEINASEDVPCTVEGHHWKKVELQQTDYIAKYKINIGFGTAFVDKFVWLSANSKDKQKDNEHKYEKARKLSLKIDEIENTVLKDIKSNNVLKRENALITYIVLTYGIRIGNDLGEDNFRDKNVRGASTLCCENIILEDDNYMRLSFIGKDSVPYNNSMKVDSFVYDEFKKIMSEKKLTDKIYDFATSVSVNEYLKSIYKGDISIKLFRTAKAGITLAKEIQKRKWLNLTDKEFKNALMECCLQTSLLLNHHKSVSEEQKDKFLENIAKRVKNAKIVTKRVIDSTNKKLKKLEDERKDFEFCLEGKLFDEKIKDLDIKKNELKLKIKNARKRYNDIKKEMEFKKFSQDINLETALNAYSTPRLPLSLCKYADKNPRLIYSEAQLKKFEWANNVDSSYWKKYPKI